MSDYAPCNGSYAAGNRHDAKSAVFCCTSPICRGIAFALEVSTMTCLPPDRSFGRLCARAVTCRRPGNAPTSRRSSAAAGPRRSDAIRYSRRCAAAGLQPRGAADHAADAAAQAGVPRHPSVHAAARPGGFRRSRRPISSASTPARRSVSSFATACCAARRSASIARAIARYADLRAAQLPERTQRHAGRPRRDRDARGRQQPAEHVIRARSAWSCRATSARRSRCTRSRSSSSTPTR